MKLTNWLTQEMKVNLISTNIFIIKVLSIVLAKDLEMIDISADEINLHFLGQPIS